MMMAGPFSPIVVIAKSAKHSFRLRQNCAPPPHCAKIRRSRCETVPVYLRETDENRGCKTAFDQLLFPPVPLTRKRYAASVRRQSRQKLRSCCALAERCGKKRRYLLDSQNRTPG